MIYAVGNREYIQGKREIKQTSIRVDKIQKLHLGSKAVYHSNLTENHKLFLIIAGDIMLAGEKIENGNIIYISKFSAFAFNVNHSAEIIEMDFGYSENIPFFNEAVRIMQAPMDVCEYINRIYYNGFFYNNLIGVNEGLLLNVLNTLNMLCNSHSAELNLYQNCCQWIEQHVTYYITAKTVAEAMNCTVAHLNRVIKKHSGKCLSTNIAERRVSAIKHLIKDQNYTTREIADQMEFESTELLCKFFKYHTGISIKEYREKTLL